MRYNGGTMDLPAYTVCKSLTDNLWYVNKRRKVVSLGYADKADADRKAQQLVEDDNWNANNR